MKSIHNFKVYYKSNQLSSFGELLALMGAQNYGGGSLQKNDSITFKVSDITFRRMIVLLIKSFLRSV